jgi:ATPase family AAA domain-containing protein 3A/B
MAAGGFLAVLASASASHAAEAPSPSSSPFSFPFFSSRRTPSPLQGKEDDEEEAAADAGKSSRKRPPQSPLPDPKKAEYEESKVSFDPEALERGARVLREINNSANSKKVALILVFR